MTLQVKVTAYTAITYFNLLYKLVSVMHFDLSRPQLVIILTTAAI